MERRGEDRDVGIPNSTTYNHPPQITQESPHHLKLPLAPIVSTPQDRRGGYATVSARRGSAIFSPTQTLDHHHFHHQHHHRQQLNPPPPQQPQVLKQPTPDPDPPTPTTDDGASNSKAPASPPRPTPQPPHQPPPPPPPTSSANITSIRYRECLKNHAASMGGHVVDGCGEFMPSGEEGTVEALRCAACDCHRNFHRKEVEGELHPSNRPPFIHSQNPPSMAAHRHHKHTHSGPPPPPAMVNFGGNSGGTADESSSEGLNMFQSTSGGGGGHAVMQPSFSGSKKRFRTKFSNEQKDRMQEFAERIGWRIQKQDEPQVEQFCNEAGVKRRVFKVWMHNNKQAMKKRASEN